MPDLPSLGEFEHIVLLAVMRLDDQAYGVTIRKEIRDCTGREPAPGALYTTMDRLEDKGLLVSTMGDPTPERGGRAKRYFRVSAQGMQAVNRARRCYLRMWEGLPFPGVSMRSAQIAEWVLGLFLEPDRAAAYTGDLMEEAAGHGPIWFWSSVARLAIMRFWYDISENPFFLANALLRACVLNLALTSAFFTGTILLLMVPEVLFPGLFNAGVLHSIFGSQLSSIGDWIVDDAALILVPAFYTGRWIAARMPGREIAASVTVFAAEPLVDFVIVFLLTRIWRNSLAPPDTLADIGVNYLMNFIGLFAGALQTRSRFLRSVTQ